MPHYIKREGIEYLFKDAKKELLFDIREEDIKRAKGKQHNKCECVVAQAVKAAVKDVERIEVGAACCVVFSKGVATRYVTAHPLKKGLVQWDATGKWNLLSGVYHLLPPAPSRTLNSHRDKMRKLRIDNRDNHQAKKEYNTNPRFLKWKGNKVVEVKPKSILRKVKLGQ